jgi:hypothetical protein
MDLNGIAEIEVETAGDEVTYRLPVRPLGLFRLFGLLPMGFSVLWFSGLGHMLAMPIRALLNHHQQSFDYFQLAFLLPFVLAGCVPVGLGLGILFGRCRVRWRDGHLTVTELVGPFGWPRRLPRSPVRKFVVAAGPATGAEGQAAPAGPIRAGVLLAQFETGRPRVVAAGYPREWLEAMAQDLSRRVGCAQPAAPKVEVVAAEAPGLPTEEAVAQPAGSQVVIRRQSASTTLEVPAPGLRKGSMGLILFASVWCVFVAAISAAMLLGSQPGKPRDLGFLPVLFLFWAVGLGLFAGAFYLGKRRASITAGRSGVTVIQTSPFGTKRRDVKRTEIATVGVGFCNVEVNHRRIEELQIRLLTGKKVGFFAGRDPEELRWIASELRTALGLTEQASPAVPEPGLRGNTAGTTQTFKKPPLAFVVLYVFVAAGIGFWWFLRSSWGRSFTNRRPPIVATPNKPVNPAAGIPGLAFTSYSPSGSYNHTNGWSLSTEAHADWFIAAASGRLTGLEVELEPVGDEPESGKARIFLTKDRGGFPGTTLEGFTVQARRLKSGAEFKPITIESTKQPVLRAGEKYWLCARTTGAWRWHYNALNLIQNSARELKRGKWASAGDYTYVCAFSVKISTNEPPANLVEQPEGAAPPAEKEDDSDAKK